jgi:hypothetical protein
VFSLATNLWQNDKLISREENFYLEWTFTADDAILDGMKGNSGPGPDGVHVSFFKKFWETLKVHILQILNDFTLWRVDISRLNFGIRSLIPKVKGADSIKKIRTIDCIHQCHL